MPSYKRPGVYTLETLSPSTPSAQLGATVAMFMGSSWKGPTAAVLVTSWGQYVNQFGGFPPPGTLLATGYNTNLPYAVYQFFNNGGAACYVARILGTGATVATKVINDGSAALTLTVNAINAGYWANGTATAGLSVDIVYRAVVSAQQHFDLIVHYGGSGDGNIVERWLDLTMDPTDPRYAPAIINGVAAGLNQPSGTGSFFISVVDGASVTAPPGNAPVAGLANFLLGGVSEINPLGGTAPAGAIPSNTQITNAVTATTSPIDALVDPIINLNLPGVSTATIINAAIAYFDPALGGRDMGFVVVDPPALQTVAQAVTYTASLTVSSFAAVYFPWLTVTDPSSTALNATRSLPPGGAILGQYVATDTLRGVQKAAAGISNRLAATVAPERNFTSTELDTLNVANVNAIKTVPGFGVCVFGARTLKLTQADKYVPVRRTLNYIKSSLLLSTRFAIFEPNDSLLWQNLQSVCAQFLGSLWQRGGLRGASHNSAFYVICDSTINTPSTIASGQVNIEIGVALQIPAEFIVIKIGQFEGGNTVKEV